VAPLAKIANTTRPAVDDTVDPNRPITFIYDPLDRVLSQTTSLGAASYTCDSAGRP
jgi:YD repeat-containing protein